jgi:hypothetical protein
MERIPTLPLTPSRAGKVRKSRTGSHHLQSPVSHSNKGSPAISRKRKSLIFNAAAAAIGCKESPKGKTQSPRPALGQQNFHTSATSSPRKEKSFLFASPSKGKTKQKIRTQVRLSVFFSFVARHFEGRFPPQLYTYSFF